MNQKHRFRFWVQYKGGWVKLTVSEGRTIETREVRYDAFNSIARVHRYNIRAIQNRKRLIDSWERATSGNGHYHHGSHGINYCNLTDLQHHESAHGVYKRMSEGQWRMKQDASSFKGHRIRHPKWEIRTHILRDK
jgi:hypothetical protein